ncbi:MAG: hypothetical protein NTX65_04980 [Ignavibacteriales bacterium]|nr:hypothetical protein [Ignavibacteriales bacterium]
MAFIDDLKNTILSAAGTELGHKPQAVFDYLKREGQNLAETLVMITEGVVKGSITIEEAPILLNQQKEASIAILAAAEGMTKVIAQNAVNNAMDAVKNMVNSKLPILLI